MPRIAAYHSELCVQKKDGSLVVVKADLDDYYTDVEVLEMLGMVAGAGSVGELVEAVEKKGLGNYPPCLLAVRISEGDEAYQLRHQWDDPI